LNFSADGKRLLSASGNGNSVQLWELGQSTSTHTTLPMPGALEPWTALFSPDGKTLAATGVDAVYAWDLADLNAKAKVLLPVEGYATEMAFSPNGNTLAVGNYGPVMYLKDLTRPDETASELLGHIRPNAAWSVAFSPDGKRLASGGITDAAVRLWDLDSPDASSIVLGRHDTDVTRVRFSPNGKQLASSSHDYSVRLWNVEDPDALPIVLSGHEGKVWSLAYSLDGKHLVTGSSDRTIRIWDLTHPLNASTTQEIADKVCQKVWRNLTLDEWHKFVGVKLPYERTCPNLPTHPSLFEAAEKLAKENDMAGAVALLERAVELDPKLDIDPKVEAQRFAELDTK
jgi:WD40 repeat protein